jgi:peptidoglycan/LPS O-acetylase OafA/YrhL
VVVRTRFSRAVLWALSGVGAAILVLSLGFSAQVYRWGLGRAGLDMTLLAVGACMFIAASAQTQWKVPLVLRPLLKIGQYSYEIYLTHMFVVFTFFNLFVSAGKPMRLVPVLFVATILIAGVLGGLVAGFYSEPMNRLLRRQTADGSKRLDSVIDSEVAMKKTVG